MSHALAWAAGGTGFTFLMTTLGAAMVFFFRKAVSANIQRIFLGFAAGVMIAASVWSLLIPAMEEAQAAGVAGWLPAGGGFVLGVAFLMLLDSLLPHLHPGAKQAEGLNSKWQRSTMLMLAVTLHNIPEGMAVGLAFALAAQHNDSSAYAAAMALAIGMGIQNFPEGAAISLPLRQEGMSRGKSFVYGMLSGIVEPIFGVLVVLAAQLCSGCNDVRCGGGADPRGASGRTFQRRHSRRNGWIFADDGAGCGAGIGVVSGGYKIKRQVETSTCRFVFFISELEIPSREELSTLYPKGYIHLEKCRLG